MDILERLKKIKALAESGVDGEKSAAQSMLNELVAKYNITVAELEADKRTNYEFELESKNEAVIFKHCVIKSFGNKNILQRGSLIKILNLTTLEYLLFKDFLDFHINQYNKEIKKVLYAYVNKHDLYPSESETYALSEDSTENFQSVLRMMDDVNYHKSLT